MFAVWHGDLDFEIVCSLAGALFGVLAASLVRIERDGQTGRIVQQAGLAEEGLPFREAPSRVSS